MALASVEHALEIMGESVPALGYGTWQVSGAECVEGVRHALELGYRHIDTAQMYENEAEVGEGIARSGVDRANVFLTTKLAMDNLRREKVIESTETSLRELRTDYVDLLLIHWPGDDVPLEETLEAMVSLQAGGRTRRIGVSNFPPKMFRQAREIAEIFCNQCEYHPFLSQDRLLGEVRDQGALFTAYSPLAKGKVFEDETLGETARAHGKTPGQVALRWLLQQQVAAIPRSTSPEHREQNMAVFDFALSDEEMERISALGSEDGRMIDPEWGPDWNE